MRICSKRECDLVGAIKYSCGTTYCFKCNGFNRMRHAAQTKNKYRPSWKELEGILPLNMICPVCDKQMIWHILLGTKGDVISLQHNHNGSIALICCSCNSAHGHSHLGDKYFSLKENEKYCPRCKKISFKNKFGKTKRNKDHLNDICKQCNNQRSKIRYYKNKELGEQ